MKLVPASNGTDVVWVDKLADHVSFDLLVDDEELKYNLSLKHATSGHVTDVVPLNSDARAWAIKDDYGLKGISYLDADKWDMSSYYNHMIDVMNANGYVAYALTAAPDQMTMDVVVTNQNTGAKETYTVKKGEYVREGKSTGVAVRTMELADGKFDLQFIAPSNANIDIEVQNNGGGDVQFRTYDNGKEVKNKVHHGLLKQSVNEKMKIKQNKGKSEVMNGAQKVK